MIRVKLQHNTNKSITVKDFENLDQANLFADNNQYNIIDHITEQQMVLKKNQNIVDVNAYDEFKNLLNLPIENNYTEINTQPIINQTQPINNKIEKCYKIKDVQFKIVTENNEETIYIKDWVDVNINDYRVEFDDMNNVKSIKKLDWVIYSKDNEDNENDINKDQG